MESQLNKEIIKIAFDIQKHLIPDYPGKYQSPLRQKWRHQLYLIIDLYHLTQAQELYSQELIELKYIPFQETLLRNKSEVCYGT